MKLGIDKFDDLVECFEKLPGVGKKSAIRYAYFVSLSDSFLGLRLANSIENAVSGLQKCQICGGISENEICEICADETRNGDILCVIESSKDMLVIEQRDRAQWHKRDNFRAHAKHQFRCTNAFFRR